MLSELTPIIRENEMVLRRNVKVSNGHIGNKYFTGCP